MSAPGTVRAPLQSVLGVSPLALPLPNGHTHLKIRDLHFLPGELGWGARCKDAAKLLPAGSCSTWKSSAAATGTPFPSSVLTCPAICLWKAFYLTYRTSIVYSCRSSGCALNVQWATSAGNLAQTLLLQELTRLTSSCLADQSFFPSCHLPQTRHLSPSLPLLFSPPSAEKVREYEKMKRASLPVIRADTVLSVVSSVALM